MQKEDLNEYSNEKYRLTRLCNDYSKIEDTALINELKEKCIELLEHTNSKKLGIKCQKAFIMYDVF